MTTYPPAKRTDGVCARPGCDKKVPTGPPKTMPNYLRAMFLEALASEPFCSSLCCREAFGVTEGASIYIEPSRNIPKHFGTEERNEYRRRNRVPCEGGCGTFVEGKGRATRPGQDPNRPFLCITCWHKSTRKKKAAA